MCSNCGNKNFDPTINNKNTYPNICVCGINNIESIIYMLKQKDTILKRNSIHNIGGVNNNDIMNELNQNDIDNQIYKVIESKKLISHAQINTNYHHQVIYVRK